MEDLRVSVAVGKVTHYKDDAKISEYSNKYEVLEAVTHRKVAGLSHGEFIY